MHEKKKLQNDLLQKFPGVGSIPTGYGGVILVTKLNKVGLTSKPVKLNKSQ
jgi:hypothetical protein